MDEKRTQLSWDDKANICKQWQLSGLSKSQFCAQENLVLTTFTGWCSRLWPSQRKQSKLRPVKVREAENTVEGERESIVIELTFPGDVTARIKLMGARQTRFLLQELLHASAIVR